MVSIKLKNFSEITKAESKCQLNLLRGALMISF